MKKTFIIIAIILFLSAIGIYIYSRRPKVCWEKVDWKNKSVDFQMSVNGEKRSGTQSLDDSIITDIKAKDGKHTFYIKSIHGLQVIELAILKDGKVVAGILVNFKTESVTPLTKI